MIRKICQSMGTCPQAWDLSDCCRWSLYTLKHPKPLTTRTSNAANKKKRLAKPKTRNMNLEQKKLIEDQLTILYPSLANLVWGV
jgi:hypothetical protein